MFDAYKVAVRISLIDKVSPALAGIASYLAKTGKDVDQLQTKLNKIKMLGAVGAASGAAGFAGLGLIGKMIKPAEEYAHQLNIINMAGWTHAEQVAAIGDAWKNTRSVITTTATDNLRTLLDLKNVLGTMDEARVALPIVSRIQAVLAASSEGKISGNSKELGYSMAKALDIIGAAKNPEEFEKQADMMAKVIIATQGRVTPEAFKSVFQYARQARYSMSDEFKYEILPSLIQENSSTGGGGGGSRGVGPMLAALYRVTNQGYINKKSLPLLEHLGLVEGNSALKTTTQGTTVGKFKAADLAAANPFEWVQKVLMPSIYTAYGKNVSEQQVQSIIGEIFRGNQLAASMAMEFAIKPQNFIRDQENIRRTMSIQDAYKASISADPNTAHKALAAQWENFKTALTMSVVPVLVPALMKLTQALNDLAEWARKHQQAAKDITLAFAGLFGVMAIGGTTLAAIAAMKGLFMVARVLAIAPLMGVVRGFALIAPAASGLLTAIAPIAGAFAAAAVGVTQAYEAITTGTSGAYKLLSNVGQWATHDKNWNLGSQIYDWTHKSYDPNATKKDPMSRLGTPNQELHHWQPAATPAQTKQALNVFVQVDGKTIASSVQEHLIPTSPRGSTNFNPLSTPYTTGMTLSPGM